MEEASHVKKKMKLQVNGPSEAGCSASAKENVPSNSIKVETMNGLGLEETVPSPRSKSKGSVSSVKENAHGNAEVNTDALIEKFVSTLNSLITGSEKKIIAKVYEHRKKCQEKYLRSRDFEFRINSALENIHRDPSNMYVYIKDVYDEMKLYRNSRKQTKCETVTTSVESESSEAVERKIRSLEKMLKKLHRVINKLKKEEVSLDEMDDGRSAYIYEDRMTKRFIKVWSRLSELKKRSSRLENNVDKKFHYSASRYPELNSKVEIFVNSSKMFPDYSDILKITRTVNEGSSLGLSESALQILAQEVFHDVGHELKRRRESDYQDLFGSYLTDDVEIKNDPAESDLSLRESLEQNYREGQSKLQKVLRDFTEKQVTLKLEPKEVGDLEKDDVDGSNSDNEEDKFEEQKQIKEEMYSDEEILDHDKTLSVDDKMSSEDENNHGELQRMNSDDEKSHSEGELSD